MLPGWKRFYVVALSMTNLLFLILTQPVADKFKRHPEKVDKNDSYVIMVVQTIQVFLYIAAQILLARHIVEFLILTLFLLWNCTIQIILSSGYLIFTILYGHADPLVMSLAILDITFLVVGLVFWNVAEEYLQMGIQEDFIDQ
ncbi:uncharacterized protein [Drosophila pseudoobscura]|uniref:Uncharacterized protein n=1 Tax=Drosophila pseudoobscura pseudoobscura TaxID=46245 RepID=A0A6I8VIZ4_DROPS|nr:uncharacterized protein LOC26532679 [Drosophila pseudoobscura]